MDYTEGTGFDQGETIDVAEKYRSQVKDICELEEWSAKAKRWGIEGVDGMRVDLTDNYLIKGLLSAGSMSVIYGPSNSGKTFLALDLAYRIAGGIWWHGKRTKRAAVLYLATEGGRGLTNRLIALRDEHGSGFPFFVRRGGIDLRSDDTDMNSIIEMCNGIKEHTGQCEIMVVVDTLSRAMAGGDENGSADMTKMVAKCDAIREATKAHLLLVHHTGKDEARGARGHSSLRAAVDTEIQVQEDESVDGLRHAVVRKQRDYETGAVYDFVLRTVVMGTDPEGDEITTCIAATASDAGVAQLDPRDVAAILAEIDIGMSDGERYTDQRNNKDDRRWAGHIISGSLGVSDDEAASYLASWIRQGMLYTHSYKSQTQRKDRNGLFVRK